ncbi:MAG: PepSY domain-containing protein [Acidobacteriota bacterium]
MIKKIAAVLLLTTAVAYAAPKPKLSMKQARGIALKAVPGSVKSEEYEHEKGKWVYSFDIATKDPGVMEVLVDANTGKIIETTHETPAQEAKEKAKEKAKH